MFEVLLWWMLVQLIGIVALPLTFLLFQNLSDRGFPFSKPLGILFLCYALWLAGTLHILPNSRGSIIILLLVALFGALFVFSQCRDNLISFVRSNWRLLLVEEAVFLGGFLIWAFVRSYNPEIRATEQPMDFGFLNAIYRSEFFPPNDPWLAGHSISYYYFGYLIMATLAKLSGLATGVAYNLSLAMLFGLIALGSFGVVFNLAATAKGRESSSREGRATAASIPGRPHRPDPSAGRTFPRGGGRRGPVMAGLVAALFVVGIGNLEGALELLRAHNVGTAEFWRWIGIKDALQPYASAQWYPTENWWWWRATRVINTLAYTFDANGAVSAVSDQVDYTITEFPFFSFLLGDMHPHVMALPFALLAVALSLNILWQGRDVSLMWLKDNGWRLGVCALGLGALGFLNSWDFPTYTGLFLASAALGIYASRRRLDRDLIKAIGALALAVGGAGVLLYLPFYLSFRSQASGVLPVLGPGSQFLHYAIIWGLFLVVLAAFLVLVAKEGQVGLGRTRGSAPTSTKPPGYLSRLHWWPLAVALAPVVAWAVLVWGAGVAGFVKDVPLGSFFAGRAWRLLPILAAVVVAFGTLDLWVRAQPKGANGSDETAFKEETCTSFVLLLIAFGFLLTLGPELFYVRDVFGTRMNTIFKFYYQAWVLLALASGYGLYYVSLRWSGRGIWRFAGLGWAAITLVLLASSLVYPLASVTTKTNSFTGPATLDGTAYVKRENPGEYQAVQWLIANAPDGAVIAEATGGQYSEYARVATRTGLPNLLGWAGHEWQWRGSDKDYRGRAEDVDTIYRNVDRNQVLALLQKYNVTYVYAGHLERNKYGQAALDKFAAFTDTAFKNENTAIYRVRR